jgi:hypothetical protein
MTAHRPLRHTVSILSLARVRAPLKIQFFAAIMPPSTYLTIRQVVTVLHICGMVTSTATLLTLFLLERLEEEVHEGTGSCSTGWSELLHRMERNAPGCGANCSRLWSKLLQGVEGVAPWCGACSISLTKLPKLLYVQHPSRPEATVPWPEASRSVWQILFAATLLQRRNKMLISMLRVCGIIAAKNKKHRVGRLQSPPHPC